MDAHGTVLIVGGGPGVSASCARLFASKGMSVAIAARTPEKSALTKLKQDHGAAIYQCDASDAQSVANLFTQVSNDLGRITCVIHNIDGRSPDIFRKEITEADPNLALSVLKNSAFSAFVVGQQAAQHMLDQEPDDSGQKGTIIYTNASAAFKGYPKSGAFAMASHAKSGLAQSMARELMPKGIHIVHAPIDAAIGWTQEDGSRAHWAAGTTVEDNMADPDRIADTYLHLHLQHRSTWTYEAIMRPWVEKW